MRHALRDPVAWTDVIQVVKTAVPAAAARVIASRVFGLPRCLRKETTTAAA